MTTIENTYDWEIAVRRMADLQREYDQATQEFATATDPEAQEVARMRKRRIEGQLDQYVLTYSHELVEAAEELLVLREQL